LRAYHSELRATIAEERAVLARDREAVASDRVALAKEREVLRSERALLEEDRATLTTDRRTAVANLKHTIDTIQAEVAIQERAIPGFTSVYMPAPAGSSIKLFFCPLIPHTYALVAVRRTTPTLPRLKIPNAPSPPLCRARPPTLPLPQIPEASGLLSQPTPFGPSAPKCQPPQQVRFPSSHSITRLHIFPTQIKCLTSESVPLPRARTHSADSDRSRGSVAVALPRMRTILTESNKSTNSLAVPPPRIRTCSESNSQVPQRGYDGPFILESII
jgi:hypothetical protein